MGDYYGDASSQLDGTRNAHYNCVGACGSSFCDTASLGYWDPSPASVRAASGTPDYTGISYTNLDKAVYSKTNGEVSMVVRYWAPDTLLGELLSDSRTVGVSIWTGVTSGTEYATGSFVGRHNVLTRGRRTVYWTGPDGIKHSQKQVRVMDPGHTDAKWKWWPLYLLLKAARRSTGTTDEIHVYYSARLKGSYRTFRKDGAYRSSARDSVDNIVGRYKAGESVIVKDTVRGEEWNVNDHKGKGYAKTSEGYVVGGKLKAR